MFEGKSANTTSKVRSEQKRLRILESLMQKSEFTKKGKSLLFSNEYFDFELSIKKNNVVFAPCKSRKLGKGQKFIVQR